MQKNNFLRVLTYVLLAVFITAAVGGAAVGIGRAVTGSWNPIEWFKTKEPEAEKTYYVVDKYDVDDGVAQASFTSYAEGVDFPTKDITVVLNDEPTTFYFAYYEGQYFYTNKGPLYEVMEYDDEISMYEALNDGIIFVIYDPTEIEDNAYVTTKNKKDVLKFEVTKEKVDYIGVRLSQSGELAEGMPEVCTGASSDIKADTYKIDTKSDLKVLVNGREKTLTLCGTNDGGTLWTEVGRATAWGKETTTSDMRTEAYYDDIEDCITVLYSDGTQEGSSEGIFVTSLHDSTIAFNFEKKTSK